MNQTPLVSIIIPVHNRWDLTRQCLISIKEKTGYRPYEVLVMDNGSNDGTPEGLAREFPWVIALRDHQRLTFSIANNRAVLQANGELILFLNNDTVVTGGWLEPLVEVLLSDPKIVATGPKLLYPDGTIQQAGVIFHKRSTGYHACVGWPGDDPRVNVQRDFNSLTGACLLCRKKDILDIGGFDEQFVNGCEDTDLNLRWRKSGRRIVYVPRSTVYHHESQSPGRNDKDRENANKLSLKWMDKLPQDDIDYYCEIRKPQKGRNCIGVVMICSEKWNDMESALFLLFIHSYCDLEILLVIPDDTYVLPSWTKKEPTLFSVAYRNSPLIDEWIRSCRALRGFTGFLVLLNGTIGLVCSWDNAFITLKNEPFPLAPLIEDEKNRQAWLRYFINIQRNNRTSLVWINAFFKKLFADCVLYSNNINHEILFFGTAISHDRIRQAIRGGPDNDREICCIQPAALGRRNDMTTEGVPIPKASIIVTTNDNNENARLFISKTLSLYHCSEVEIICIHYGTLTETLPAEWEKLVRDNLFLIRSRHSQDPLQARNHAARVALGHYLVFITPDVAFDDKWLERLIAPLVLCSTVLGTTAEVATPSAQSDSRKATSLVDNPDIKGHACNAVGGKCFAVRRSVFVEAGGYAEDTAIPAADADLSNKLQRVENGIFWFVPDIVRTA